jgi:hypothetical protein
MNKKYFKKIFWKGPQGNLTYTFIYIDIMYVICNIYPVVHGPAGLSTDHPLVGSDLLGQNHALLNNPPSWPVAIFFWSLD